MSSIWASLSGIRAHQFMLDVIGDKSVDGRPAVGRVSGLAVASKDGRNYLFVASNWQIQVFEITVGR